MIAISGIMEVNSGQIVLAGDPKQLGPILRSPFAIKYGLGMFIDRYCNTRLSTKIIDSKIQKKKNAKRITDAC